MTGIDLIAFSVPVLILLLGGYLVHQARRSRESELNYRLRKCQIALHDAEQALDNTVHYYKTEIGRLKGQGGGPDITVTGGPEGPRATSDIKFRQAKNAFARLYHPDRLAVDGAEKRIRTELFKEFWDELERIERRSP